MTRRKASRVVYAVALLALLVVSSVPVPVTSLELSEEQKITDNDDPEGSPRISVDSEGNYHVAYLLDDGGDYAKLMYRKVSGNGATIEGPLQVSPGTVEVGYGDISISADAGGRAHIVFSVQLTNDDARDLYYAQVSPSGGLSVSARSIFSSDVNCASLDIDTDASGNSYIVWNERSDPPVIKWVKLSSSGSVSRSEKTVSGDLGFGGDMYYPVVGVSPTGESFVAWQQKDNQVSRISIYYTALTSSGSVDVDPMEVHSHAVYDLTYLEGAINSREDLVLTFVQNNEVHVSLIEDDGSVRNEYSVASAMFGEVYGPDVEVAPNDDIFVGYGLRENLINAPWNVFARVRWESNDTWSAADQLNEGTSGVSRVVVAAGQDEAATVFVKGGDITMVTIEAQASNEPPVASLSVSPSAAGVDEVVTFDGGGSTDPDDDDYVDEYYFEWGDGGNSGWITDTTALHAYSGAGTYTARLRVRDSYGLECTQPATAVVTVTTTPPNRAPTAVLVADPTEVEVDELVSLNGGSSTDSDGIVREYNFVYGDGQSSGWTTSSVKTHSYSSAGVYTATLQVKDDDDAVSENTASAIITVLDVNEKPTAEIVSVSPNPAIVGEDITFEGSGTDPDGSITGYYWESNLDGELSTLSTFVHGSLEVGLHTISFKVQDDDDEWSEEVTLTLDVNANTKPELEDLTETTKEEQGTLIEFRVRYTDAENDRPTVATFWYGKDGNWKSEALAAAEPGDTDYTDGKEYFYNKKFDDPGDYKYYFEFTSIANGKTKTAQKDLKIEEDSGLLPGPGVGLTAASLVLVALVAALHRRRWMGGQ